MARPSLRDGLRRVGRSFFLWFGALWLVAGLFAVGAGVQDARDQRRWVQGGLIQGVVVGKSIERAERGKHPRTGYIVRYRFTTPAGQAVEGEDRVEVEAWERIEEGARVTVQHLAGTPGSSRIERPPEWGSPIVSLLLGGIVAIVGSGLVVRNLIRLRRELRLLAEGSVTQGTVLAVEPGRTVVNGVPRWRVHYRYRDDRGREREGWSEELPPDEAHAWRPGDTAPVRFDRERPEESVWAGADAGAGQP